MAEYLSHLPLFYRKSKTSTDGKSSVVQTIFAAIEAERARYNAYIERLKLERYLATSTEYLGLREEVIGLPVQVLDHTCVSLCDYTTDELEEFTVDELEDFCVDNHDAWYEERRNTIRARIRGCGVVNAAFLKRIIATYTDETCNIECDYNNYTVKFTFPNSSGMPALLGKIKAIVREYLPAHLIPDWGYKRRTWDEVNTGTKTWEDLNAYTWNDILETEDIFDEND